MKILRLVFLECEEDDPKDATPLGSLTITGEDVVGYAADDQIELFMKALEVVQQIFADTERFQIRTNH